VWRELLLLSGLFLLSGCSWTVREETDQTVRDLVDHPFDLAPQGAAEARTPAAEAHTRDGTSSSSRSGEKIALVPEVPIDVQTTAWMESQQGPARRDGPPKDDRVRLAAWTQAPTGPIRHEAAEPPATPGSPELHIPPRVPGSEAPEIHVSPGRTPAEQQIVEREIARIYPELPPPPVEPAVQPGPGGKPYTLADFQRLAAANSPALRQAASDVEAAKGNLIQAMTYPNPIASYLVDPSNNNSTAGVQGGAIEQIIITGGKMKLGVAAAQKSLDNAILALKRARNDLSTAVRNAYFTVLVDVETLAVTRALVQFSDEIYRLQVGLQRAAQFAPYEPTALRAQTYINRLAYKQAIASYIYDWKALVATLGLPQLPLAEIAGRVDRFIPYYDYDEVRAYALQHHTDILTARNGVEIAQYNLKVAQVTPVFPNLDVRYSLEKDFVLGPFGTYQTLALGLPLPIWDQNKGNIIAAQGALVRAGEESHRVEVTLTNGLALAYEGYKNNLYAMEYYRRYILPDLVNYYRGVYTRRQVDISVAFGDLVFAQQNLTTNVTAYLGILGSLWSSVVSVADYLQTDDLFQLAQPRDLPELPDLKHLELPPAWVCGHATVAASCAGPAGAGSPTIPAAGHPGPDAQVTRGPGAAAPEVGLSASGPAAGIPADLVGSDAGPPPPQAGAVAAPPPQSPVVSTPEVPRAANPTDRPTEPPSPPGGGGIASVDRSRAPELGPATLIKAPFAQAEAPGSQAPGGPTALVKSYFGQVGTDVPQALVGPAAPVNSLFGEEQKHAGQDF
jgi:cobalt-zinc-cadmium efflux system outer membrane protein